MRIYKKNQILKPHDEKIRMGLDEDEPRHCKECRKRSEKEVCEGCRRVEEL